MKAIARLIAPDYKFGAKVIKRGQRECSTIRSPGLTHYNETVAKVNSLTILLARLSRLCRKDEAQGAEGEV